MRAQRFWNIDGILPSLDLWDCKNEVLLESPKELCVMRTTQLHFLQGFLPTLQILFFGALVCLLIPQIGWLALNQPSFLSTYGWWTVAHEPTNPKIVFDFFVGRILLSNLVRLGSPEFDWSSSFVQNSHFVHLFACRGWIAWALFEDKLIIEISFYSHVFLKWIEERFVSLQFAFEMRFSLGLSLL